MSLIGTKLPNRESLYFGLAELYLGDSLTNESSVTAVFDDTNYFACLAEISFVVLKKYIETFSSRNGITFLSKVLMVSSDFEINIEFVELTEKNFSYSLGGNGVDTNVLDNLLSQPVDLRAELVFTYPNKINTMVLILPKCKVVTTKITFGFQTEEPMSVPMQLIPLRSTHANWVDNPIGKIIFT